MYTAFICRIYNNIGALKKNLTPEIEITDFRTTIKEIFPVISIVDLPLFQGSKTVYTVTKFLPVIGL